MARLRTPRRLFKVQRLTLSSDNTRGLSSFGAGQAGRQDVTRAAVASIVDILPET